MRTILALLCFLFTTICAIGQDSTLTKNRKKGRIELLALTTTHLYNFSNLNERLPALGEKKLPIYAQSLGFSIAAAYPKFIVGMEFASYVLSNKRGGYSRVFISKHLINTKNLVVNPQIGYGTNTIHSFIKKQSTNNFDSIVTSNPNRIELSHRNNFFDFTLGFKLVAKSSDVYWQFLKVGYKYGLKNKEWKSGLDNITNAPSDRGSHFYAQLCIGIDR